MGDPVWTNVAFLSGFEGATAVDESQNARTLTHDGTSLSSVQAKFGTQSLSIPTTKHIKTASIASIISGTALFTIEGWFYFTALPGEAYLVAQADVDAGQPWALVALNAGGSATQLVLYLDTTGDNSVDTQVFSTSTFTAATGVWVHLAADFDGTDYRFYADGTFLGGESGSSYSISSGSAPIVVGSADSSSGGSGFFYGDLAAYADEVRITVGEANYASDTGFTPPAAAFPRASLDTVVEEGFTVTGEAGLGDVFNDTLVNSVGVAHTQATTWIFPRSLTQGFGISPFPEPVLGRNAVATDGFALTEAGVASYGQVIVERLRVAFSQVPNTARQFTLTDTVRIIDRLLPGIPLTIAETIGVALDQQVQDLVTISESLGIQQTLAPIFAYNRSISETLQLVDVLGRFFGGEINETLTVAEALAGTASLPVTLAETVSIAQTVTPQMVLRVVAAEELDITATDALNMIFSPTVNDGFEISAAYLSPGGGILTWAMNTRTGAVTEYQNYAFNSFAKLGNKYIGASSSGLYELLGDDDDGTNIVATLRSGFAQWGGAHLGSFKAAYLAVRGAGQFVLRVITGDDKTYNYTVTTESMKTTKVNMGKGLRARYFAFELVSSGQDFDLDTLEFIPLIADRRI